MLSDGLYKGKTTRIFQLLNMDKSVTCEYCDSVLKNRASYRTHKSSYHRDQSGSEIKEKFDEGSWKNLKRKENGLDDAVVIYKRPQTDDEFVNEHLDNNKHLYNEGEWNNLKRKAKSRMI